MVNPSEMERGAEYVVRVIYPAHSNHNRHDCASVTVHKPMVFIGADKQDEQSFDRSLLTMSESIPVPANGHIMDPDFTSRYVDGEIVWTWGARLVQVDSENVLEPA